MTRSWLGPPDTLSCHLLRTLQRWTPFHSKFKGCKHPNCPSNVLQIRGLKVKSYTHGYTVYTYMRGIFVLRSISLFPTRSTGMALLSSTLPSHPRPGLGEGRAVRDKGLRDSVVFWFCQDPILQALVESGRIEEFAAFVVSMVL